MALLSVAKDVWLRKTESFVYVDSSHCTDDSLADVVYCSFFSQNQRYFRPLGLKGSGEMPGRGRVTNCGTDE